MHWQYLAALHVTRRMFRTFQLRPTALAMPPHRAAETCARSPRNRSVASLLRLLHPLSHHRCVLSHPDLSATTVSFKQAQWFRLFLKGAHPVTISEDRSCSLTTPSIVLIPGVGRGGDASPGQVLLSFPNKVASPKGQPWSDAVLLSPANRK